LESRRASAADGLTLDRDRRNLNQIGPTVAKDRSRPTQIVVAADKNHVHVIRNG